MDKYETVLISAATSIVTLIIVSIIFWISNWQQFLAFGFAISGVVSVVFGLLYQREPDGFMAIEHNEKEPIIKIHMETNPDDLEYYILKITRIGNEHPL